MRAAFHRTCSPTIIAICFQKKKVQYEYSIMTKFQPALNAIIAFACLSLSRAWSPSPTTNQQNSGLSRRSCIEGLATGLIGASLLPKPAFADVTNKVASPTALRSVKRAQKQLKDLLPPAQANDYMEVKAFLRTPPFVDVRKNCFILVRGAEEGPKEDEIKSTYKAFISSIEKIDGTASLGMRGRKIPELQLLEEYALVESSMQEFLRVAEEANEIPVLSSE